MLTKLKHYNIVGMKSAWADKNYYYLLFDYAINGDLTNYLNREGRLNLNMGTYLAAQILNTLAYLRQQNVVHRDLKPTNIMLNEHLQVILADFGTAKSNESSNISGFSAGGISDVSYISGMSNISGISKFSNNSSNA